MEKLSRNEFITGILTEELEATLPVVRVTKALAKEVLAGEADGIEIRVTKEFATAVIDAVTFAYKRALTEKQMNVGFGDLGQFKACIKPETTYRNPQDGTPIVKPEHLSAKFAMSEPFKTTLAETAIN